jgi:hypothetical protein
MSSRDEGRALSLAYELHTVLGKLYDVPEHGADSYVERAWDHMDEVIRLLEDGGAGKDWRAHPAERSRLSRLGLAQRYGWDQPEKRRPGLDDEPVNAGERMMELRLSMAEGRLTREQYRQAVDAIPAAKAQV